MTPRQGGEIRSCPCETVPKYKWHKLTKESGSLTRGRNMVDHWVLPVSHCLMIKIWFCFYLY